MDRTIDTEKPCDIHEATPEEEKEEGTSLRDAIETVNEYQRLLQGGVPARLCVAVYTLRNFAAETLEALTGDTEAAPEETLPVTGDPGAASYVGRYDAREALLRRVVDGLEEMRGDLGLVCTAIMASHSTLESAAEQGAGLLVSAKDAIKLGDRLGTAALRVRRLLEHLSALLEACRG